MYTASKPLPNKLYLYKRLGDVEVTHEVETLANGM
jgi:hypothetical protein